MSDQSTPVLMPIMDLFNHAPKSSSSQPPSAIFIKQPQIILQHHHDAGADVVDKINILQMKTKDSQSILRCDSGVHSNKYSGMYVALRPYKAGNDKCTNVM
jgi:hypothetical protein